MPAPGTLRRLALWFLATVAVLGAGAFAFALSGVYDVAASRDHWAITRWFIELGLRRSVATHSMGIETPPLDAADLVRLGAGHFEGGCAPCHGAPGRPAMPVFHHMLPAPPSLSDAARHWTPAELFWIVRNGLKYTGMPAWAAHARGDEVWAVVAFLKRLPELGAEDYRALANLRERESEPPETTRFGTAPDTITACARCHGDETAPPASRLVPSLAGLSESYLELSLRSYAAGTRASGIMQPIAARLTGDDVRRLAAYYAGLARQRGEVSSEAAKPEQIERGRRIATAGVPAEGIPPCLACHGSSARASFPQLAGQNAPYMLGQLELWRKGLRDRTVAGAIMAPVARRLTPEQMHDVAAYFESLTGPAPGAKTRGGVEGAPP